MADESEIRGPISKDPATGRFAPGNKSGGRRPINPEVLEILRAATPEAALKLVEGLQAVKYVGPAAKAVPDWKERREHANAILDRVHGKPSQEITGADGAPLSAGSSDVTIELVRRLAEQLGRK